MTTTNKIQIKINNMRDKLWDPALKHGIVVINYTFIPSDATDEGLANIVKDKLLYECRDPLWISLKRSLKEY